MTGLLAIDGSQGEGGGQILRTALSLSAIVGRVIRIEKIRAGRRKPGLAAQHLTAVRAVAALCRARLAGDEPGSVRLDFAPEMPVQAGDYAFDVAAARTGGSAGATGLVLQAVLPPLALAEGRSRVTVRGGTHVAWSPSFDYLREVWLPALAAMGVAARLELRRSGWFPVGQGEIEATVDGAALAARPLRPLTLLEPGRLLEVTGRALAAALPAHIAERMAARVTAVLGRQGIAADIDARALSAACPGAGVFLTARYENLRCGFNALGRRGKPAEAVAEEAVGALLHHLRSGAALERHLADQVMLPLGLADGPSRFTVEEVTSHLETNALVVERFGVACIALETAANGTGSVTITPSQQ